MVFKTCKITTKNNGSIIQHVCKDGMLEHTNMNMQCISLLTRREKTKLIQLFFAMKIIILCRWSLKSLMYTLFVGMEEEITVNIGIGTTRSRGNCKLQRKRYRRRHCSYGLCATPSQTTHSQHKTLDFVHITRSANPIVNHPFKTESSSSVSYIFLL